MKKELTNVSVTVDIETIPEKDDFNFDFNDPIPTIDDVPSHGSLKDELKIKDYKEKKLVSMIEDWNSKKNITLLKAKEELHKTGLVSYKGRIICICYAIGDGDIKNVSSDGTLEAERKMLIDLYNDIKEYKVVGFVGCNLEFDLLFLFHRSLALGVTGLAEKVRKDHGYSKERDFDIMDMASGGISWKYKISLHNLCNLLGIETSKDEMDGSQVFDYYLQGRIDEIVKYCSKDVDRTRRCYYKLK